MARVKLVVEGKEPVYSKPMSREEADSAAKVINGVEPVIASAAGVVPMEAKVVDDE